MTTETKTDPLAKARAAKAAKAAERKAMVADPPLLGETEFDRIEVVGANGKAAEAVDARGADTMSRTEMFRQRMANQSSVRTVDDLATVAGEAGEFERGDGMTPAVEHTSAGLVWMYKKEVWGWQRRRYSRNGLGEVMEAGVLPYCGSCGSSTCPGEPNQCPKGERYAYRVCPVPGCNRNNGGPRKFFDVDRSLADATPNESNDPFLIQDMAYAQSTPEQRVKIALDEHIRYYHTSYAAGLGLNNIQAHMQAPS